VRAHRTVGVVLAAAGVLAPAGWLVPHTPLRAQRAHSCPSGGVLGALPRRCGTQQPATAAAGAALRRSATRRAQQSTSYITLPVCVGL
jgi:hypothetical protein